MSSSTPRSSPYTYQRQSYFAFYFFIPSDSIDFLLSMTSSAKYKMIIYILNALFSDVFLTLFFLHSLQILIVLTLS